MCARKVKYSGGDELLLYATPKEALEASKRQAQEEERIKRQQEQLKRKEEEDRLRKQQRNMIRMEHQSRQNIRVASAPVVVQHSQPQYTHYGQTTPSIVTSPIQRPLPPSVPNSSTRTSIQSIPNSITQPLTGDRDVAIATQLFLNHDIKQKGRLTALELQNLLQNDDNSRFCISAIDSLISMFGASRFGTVNQNEFISLYKKVKLWRKVYVDNDINRSFTINVNEYHNSLQEMGYLVPYEICEKLFDQYAEFNVNKNINSKELKFDRFVESLVWLMRLTRTFRKFDQNQEGVATIHYKDFIDSTLSLGRFLSQ